MGLPGQTHEKDSQLPPAIHLNLLSRDALVKNLAFHIRIALGAIPVCRQQAARRRGHVLEMTLAVLAAHEIENAGGGDVSVAPPGRF